MSKGFGRAVARQRPVTLCGPLATAPKGGVPCHNQAVNPALRVHRLAVASVASVVAFAFVTRPPMENTANAVRRLPRACALVLALLGLLGSVYAQTPTAGSVPARTAQSATPPVAAPTSERSEKDQSTLPEAPNRSALDALLFYQLLVGEIELRQGRAAVAFEVVMDAARRTRREELFRRAADIALQARAADRALAAVRAWRQATPESLEAVRLQLQILGALNRPSEAAEPMKFLLGRTPETERSALIASIPRFFQQASDPRAVATMLEPVLQPHQQAAATRVAAHVALARVWLQAGEASRALVLVRRAHEQEPAAIGPALAALDLMAKLPAAEAVVKSFLSSAQAEPAVRMAYARTLAQAQRLGEAVVELEAVVQRQPDAAPAWLMLGALQVELKHPQQAEQALERYLALSSRPARQAGEPNPATPNAGAAAGERDDDDDDAEGPAGGPTNAVADGQAQARMLLAQAAELRQDDAAAEAHLAKIDQPKRLLEVQTRRAGILARQGRVDQARELIRKVPERTEDDARAKLVAEAQVMRDLKRWGDAYAVLEQAATRWPGDADLVYEQAMVAEKLDRLADMETLLRQVMVLKPDHQHAYNALGYSLADRGLRLDEARALIVKALELAPGDPFITDSLGWVEFRLGRHEEALRLLRQAYRARPDTEIAAHLGEVLWVLGRQEEARQVWREGRARDASNEVLRETLARLRQDL